MDIWNIKEKTVLVFAVLILVSGNLFSQFKSFDFSPPLDIPMYISGNFGEIRSDHFHTGIDIKTQGVTGFEVFAIADGYISRIKVQANGYGKAIYLKHPNGYTSVYAHLDRYRDDIKKYVIDHQYRTKSFETDIYLDAETFKVSKGELIAYSGNSGGSSGAHLHFEIRDINQQPLNVLKFPINIKDNIAPVFRSVFFYPLEEGQVNGDIEKIMEQASVTDSGNYIIGKNKIYVNGKFGIGVEVYDYLNGSRNRCGVYNVEVMLDGVLSNQLTLDYLSFSTIRYLNAHIDYEERMMNKRNVHRLYKLPNNKLHIYNYNDNKGALEVNDTLLHHISVIAKDAYGNRSRLDFDVKGTERKVLLDRESKSDVKKIRYDQPNDFYMNDIKIMIPENSLYEDLNFTYAKLPGINEYFSSLYYIQNNKVPLQKYITLAIKPDSIPVRYRNKACLAFIDDEEGPVYAGGEWKDGFIEMETRDFGKYTVMLDTVVPQILPINFLNGSDMTGKDKLTIAVKDDFSGIKSYNGYIDDKWALFDYDKKNDLLVHELDSTRFEKGKKHEMKLMAIDYLGNEKQLLIKFFW